MMHLKFPLPVGYFPKFELTPDETLAYKELVTDLVKDTRREYDSYVTTQQRHVDGRKWKLAKSKEKLHFYKRRSEFGAAAIGLTGRHRGGSMSSNSGSMDRDSDFAQSGFTPSNSSSRTRVGSRVSSRSDAASPARTMSSSSMSHHHGPHKRLLEPTLLATGVVDGTVDDFVYAFHEPTADDTKSVAAMVGSDGALVDTVVLHTIKCSKTTYLGLKWKLCRTPGGNRDFCFLEYVGVAHDASGTRYGFRVLESVKLRNCPPFADNSIIRTDISFCYLFRESGEPGVVDVYMHGAFDSSGDAVTAGGVGDSRSTMDMLLEIERCVEVAEAKKLAALVAKQASAPKPKTGSALCSICRAKAGMLSSHLNCQGCGAVICSKCRVKKTIVQTKRGATNRLKISCCKICLVHCKDTSPFEGEQISTHQQPPSLKALARKPTASSIPIQPAGLDSTQELALALPTAHHHHSSSQPSKPRTASKSRNASLTDTDYSSSMQSWPSSSVSSTYSELDDSSYVSESQLAMSSHYHHKMPAVAESPRARMQYRQQHQQQYQPQYTYASLADGTMVDASSANGYAQRSPPPPPPHMQPPMQPTNLDQHRAGLYNQMLELQMQAERAYNLANQNATLMHQQQ